MSLAAAFRSSGSFTTQDVEDLIGALDRDPVNTDEMYKFANSLYGQVPFPAKLVMAARKEMLRRYDEVHIPQAKSDAYRAENGVSFYPDRDGNMVKYGEKEAADAHAKLREMEYAQKRFGEIALSNAATMSHVAEKALKEERERKERQEMLARQAAEAERQHVRAMVEHKQRIVAVTVQAGKLTNPVAAPKMAKFKPRVAIPSR